jgi:hypothetical protein
MECGSTVKADGLQVSVSKHHTIVNTWFILLVDMGS